MKFSVRSFGYALLGVACSLMLLTSCEGLEISAGKRTIHFSAASTVSTKVYYGDEVNGFKQMIWENGDQIRIVSDRATTPSGDDTYDYTLIHDREQGARSYAKFDVEDSSSNGLQWEETGSYDFYATFPPVDVTSNGSISASIPADSYLMVAHTNTSYAANRRVFLSFYPAFTAIEVSVDSDDPDVVIDDCSLYSPYIDLVGRFTATIGDNALRNIYVTRGSSTATSDESWSYDGGATFVFFCLPQDLYGLELICFYTKDGQSRQKSVELTEDGSSMFFTACKYHRLELSLDSSEINNGGFSDMSMGGCQMYLSLLKQNAWPLQQFASSRGVYLDQNLAVNLFNYYVNNNVGRVDARDAFSGSGSNSFTEQQLPIIEEFLSTLTTYYHQNSLWASIEANDFSLVPNLTTINQLEVDPQKVNDYDLSIDVGGLQHLTSISLYKCTKLTVRDCPELVTVSIMNQDSNQESDFAISNCPKVTSFSQDWNGQRGSFSFTDMPGLQSVTLHNGRSVTVNNCAALTSLSMDQANNLTSISISNAPIFTTGTFTSVEKTTSVRLNNVSNSVSSASITMRGNGTATNGGKTNSPNVTVTFSDWGGNVKASF